MGKRTNRHQTLDLPLETIEEILFNSPLKSLLRFKCVSKSWRRLISSKFFVTEHLNRSSTSPDLANLILRSCRVCKTTLISCSLKSLLDELRNNHLPMPKFGKLIQYMGIIGSCNGLVLMTMPYNRRELILWNSSNRQARKIPPASLIRGWGTDFIYGFAYDEQADDYKVVCVFLHTKIYSCKTDSWRKIKDFPGRSVVSGLGKFVNRRLHWVAERDGGWDIVSLRLAEEKYEVVPCPENILYNEKLSLELGNLGGYLCLLTSNFALPMDVWIMKNYGGTKSWTKILTISDCAAAMPLWLEKNGDIAASCSCL